MNKPGIQLNSRPKSPLIITLFIPFFLALTLKAAPVTSYLVAWIGSFFIFYQTWFSSYRFILDDLPVHKQIMRPLFLQHFVFAGFMCSTSIFFFLDTLGYRYLTQISPVPLHFIHEQLQLVAQCQRLSVLGHACLVTGMLLVQSMHYKHKPSYHPPVHLKAINWILWICLTSFLTSIVLKMLPGIAQFSISLYNVAVIAGAVVFVNGIVTNNIRLWTLGGGIVGLNFINSTISGFKEPIIISLILISCLLFPVYKKKVLLLATPLLGLVLYFSSTYTSVFRKHAWDKEVSVEEARSEALETILSDDGSEEIEDTNWEFLAYRFSEISMFTQFITVTPSVIPYYGTELLENSVLVVIPRVLWPEKPITESLAMERVYNSGVVNRNSSVSAKSRPIVDGYLSGGMIGIVIYMLLLGSISQWLCNKAENMFGGYEVGGIIMYNGFFQQLWRGETIEFMFNTVFWSFVAMLVLFYILKYLNLLQKIKPVETPPN